MHKKKCPACGSSSTVKNGVRKGVQLYVCKACGYQFRAGNSVSDDELWQLYSQEKLTVARIASRLKVSPSTVKRRLRDVGKEWDQPSLHGGGFVHMDVTYWGRNWGLLLALDAASGLPLYLSFTGHERSTDYAAAIESIAARGYAIHGLIVDGNQALFKMPLEYPLQMCQFHMRQIVRRHVTLRPKLLACRDLNKLMQSLTEMSGEAFETEYMNWKTRWRAVIDRRSTSKTTGKSHYTHRRLRAAVHSIDFYLPYLFTFQRPDCTGMPNTNNRIEGTFTHLKTSLNNHSGMSEINRKRFICGFFLALRHRIELAVPEKERQETP